MKTATEKLYEAMFLIDSGQAARDWEGVNKTIKNILKKAKAEIVSMKKWDERKLAYDINGQSRGTYILCHFRADGQRIREIERDARLSEQIMRVLILNAEHLTSEDIEKDTPATLVEKKMQRLTEKAAEVKKKTKKEPKKAAKVEQPQEEPEQQVKEEAMVAESAVEKVSVPESPEQAEVEDSGFPNAEKSAFGVGSQVPDTEKDKDIEAADKKNKETTSQ